MALDPQQQQVRRPRYASTSRVRVEVEQTIDGGPRLIEAELQDLSRNGYQVKTLVPLVVHEPLTLKFGIVLSQSELRLPGTVRWQRGAEDGTWLVGCQTETPIDWEALGELFISGILSTEGKASG